MTITLIILCITGLEAYALYLGYDGRILLSIVGTLCTIAGWQAKKKHSERRKKNEQ
jgi:hypothetical protein